MLTWVERPKLDYRYPGVSTKAGHSCACYVFRHQYQRRLPRLAYILPDLLSYPLTAGHCMLLWLCAYVQTDLLLVRDNNKQLLDENKR
jgi:hypothetical protein